MSARSKEKFYFFRLYELLYKERLRLSVTPREVFDFELNPDSGIYLLASYWTSVFPSGSISVFKRTESSDLSVVLYCQCISKMS